MSRMRRRFAATFAVLSLALFGVAAGSSAANASVESLPVIAHTSSLAHPMGGTFCPAGQVGTELYQSVTGGYSTTGDARIHIKLTKTATAEKVRWSGSTPTATALGVQIQTVLVYLADPTTGSLSQKQLHFDRAAGTYKSSATVATSHHIVYAVYACGTEYAS